MTISTKRHGQRAFKLATPRAENKSARISKPVSLRRHRMDAARIESIRAWVKQTAHAVQQQRKHDPFLMDQLKRLFRYMTPQ